MKIELMNRVLRRVMPAGVCAGLLLSVAHAQDKPAEPKPTKPSQPDDVRFTKTKPAAIKVPFLGLALGTVDESLAAQLDLPEGVGVLVRAVMPDSPAAKAGVLQHDVLHYFNDQLLVNEPQLQTLVRRAGIGADVTLKLLRKGKEESVAVKLGEHDELPRMDVLRLRGRELGDNRPSFVPRTYVQPGEGRLFNIPLNSDGFASQVRELAERIKELEGKPELMSEAIESFRAELEKQAAEKGRDAGFKAFDQALDIVTRQAEAARKNADAARGEYGIGGTSGAKTKVWKDDKGGIRVEVFSNDNKTGGGAKGSVTATADGQGNVIVTQTNATRMVWNDGDGSGELLIENGKKKLSVKDRDGKQVFSGPVDTEEQRKDLPEKVRERLERIEKDVKVKVEFEGKVETL